MVASRQTARRRFSASRPLIDACHWCKHPIVWTNRLTQEQCEHDLRQSPPPPVVRFTAEGAEHRLPYATIDHVIPLRDGGTNKQKNLVPACRICNTRRTPSTHLETVYTTCKRCGDSMPESFKQTCSECKEKARAEFLAVHGKESSRKTWGKDARLHRQT